MSNSRRAGYHDLLPLYHAMQLRRRIMSPTRGASSGGDAELDELINTYDPAADQRLVLDNIELVMPFDRVVEHLYASMFHKRPHLQGMFPESMDFQRDRLVRSFMYLVENLQRKEIVVPAFEKLGSEHRKLGVRDAHYPTFHSALADALRLQVGDRLTPELEEAWLRVLDFAIACMIRGAHADITLPPYWRGDVVAHERRRPDLAVLRVVASEPYEYRPGQYGTVQSPLLPHAWRPYWIACAPRQDNVLEFHVRQSGTGGVSEALVQRTAVGDTLRLGPANGVMTIDADLPDHDLLLVAYDTGFAPIKAMLEALAGRPQGHRRVHLFVGARSRAELYDWPVISEMERRLHWLTAVPVISDEAPYGGGQDPVVDALARAADWSGHVAFVSGPPGQVKATVAALTELRLPAERIRYEPAVRQSENRPGGVAPHGSSAI